MKIEIDTRPVVAILGTLSFIVGVIVYFASKIGKELDESIKRNYGEK